MPRLIAFTGKAGAGKDTAASKLIEAGFVRVAFADPLKEMLAAMLNVSRDKLEDRTYKDAPLSALGIEKTPRQLLQTLGTDWGRKLVDDGLWVNLAKGRVTGALKAGHDVVITDCRFGNEAGIVRSLGGLVVRIQRAVTAAVPAHESENGVDNALCDIVINNNNSTAEDFAEKVAAILGVKVSKPHMTEYFPMTKHMEQMMQNRPGDIVVRRAVDMHDKPPAPTSRYPQELIDAAGEIDRQAAVGIRFADGP